MPTKTNDNSPMLSGALPKLSNAPSLPRNMQAACPPASYEQIALWYNKRRNKNLSFRRYDKNVEVWLYDGTDYKLFYYQTAIATYTPDYFEFFYGHWRTHRTMLRLRQIMKPLEKINIYLWLNSGANYTGSWVDHYGKRHKNYDRYWVVSKAHKNPFYVPYYTTIYNPKFNPNLPTDLHYYRPLGQSEYIFNEAGNWHSYNQPGNPKHTPDLPQFIYDWQTKFADYDRIRIDWQGNLLSEAQPV